MHSVVLVSSTSKPQPQKQYMTFRTLLPEPVLCFDFKNSERKVCAATHYLKGIAEVSVYFIVGDKFIGMSLYPAFLSSY